MQNWISAIANAHPGVPAYRPQIKRAIEQHFAARAWTEPIELPASVGFDPSALFERTVPAERPNRRGPIPGFIRGPTTEQADWSGRSPVLPMTRKVRCTNGSSNVVGLIGSSKMRGMLGTESRGESNLARLLDFAPNVWKIYTQGEKIPYQLFGKTRHTTPDFVVELYHGPTHIIEYKPAEKAISPAIQLRTAALQAACAERGWVYGILTERFVRDQPRMNNVSLLRRYRDIALTARDWQLMQHALRNGPRVIRELSQEQQISLEHVYAAVYGGLLRVDLELPLCQEAKVSLP